MAIYKKDCVIDGTAFESKRKDKLTCSPACQKKLQRQGLTPPTDIPEGTPKINEIIIRKQDPPLRVDVKDHGAVGDGVADDTAAIQSAVDTAAKKKSTGPGPLELSLDELAMQANREQMERLNARLRAKGLPLAVMAGDARDHFLATGVPEIDNLTKNGDQLGLGGLPRGKITEVFGFKGSGKTSLIKLIMKNYPDYKVLFFDAEGGLTTPPPQVTVIKGNVAEDIMDAMIDAVQDKAYDLVILDSVASLVTTQEFDGDSTGLAAMARVFGGKVKRLLAYLQPLDNGFPSPNATAALFINQYRDTTKSFGKTKYTPGGRALEYYSSLRLEFASFISKDKIIRKGMIAGQRVVVTVDKNRWGAPGEKFDFPLMYDSLQSYESYYDQKLKELGVR